MHIALLRFSGPVFYFEPSVFIDLEATAWRTHLTARNQGGDRCIITCLRRQMTHTLPPPFCLIYSRILIYLPGVHLNYWHAVYLRIKELHEPRDDGRC